MRAKLLLIALAIGALSLLLFSQGGAQPTHAAGVTVNVGSNWFCDNSFDSPSLSVYCTTTINVGDTVTFHRVGGTHNAVECGANFSKWSDTDGACDAPLWKSPTLNAGSPDWAKTFDTPGEYFYGCEFHWPSQKGKIVVVGESTPTPTPAPGPTPSPTATPAPTPIPTAEPTATPNPGATQIGVIMNEFTLAVDPSSAPPGAPVEFNVTNQGALPHEFVVLKTDLPPNALLYDENEDKAVEDAPGQQEDLGEVGGEPPFLKAGHSDLGVFDLPAGKYVLVCNIPGHYKAGMYAPFTVAVAPTATPTPSPTPPAPTPTATPSPTAPAPTQAPTPSPSPTTPATPAKLPTAGGMPVSDSSAGPLGWLLIAGLGLTITSLAAGRVAVRRKRAD